MVTWISNEKQCYICHRTEQEVTALLEKRSPETGGYVAIVPALPGCHTQGDSLAEVMENAKEAIDLYLEILTAAEKKELAIA